MATSDEQPHYQRQWFACPSVEIPFPVLWQVLEHLDLPSMARLRASSREWRNLVTDIGLDIVIEAVVAALARGLARNLFPILAPRLLRCRYLPGSTGKQAGLDTEAHLAAVIYGWGRETLPPVNLKGLFARVLGRLDALLVPPSTPFGGLLLRWWDLVASSSNEAGRRQRRRKSSRPDASGPVDEQQQDFQTHHPVARLPKTLAVERATRRAMRSRRSLGDALRSTKPDAAPLSMEGSTSLAAVMAADMQAAQDEEATAAVPNPLMHMLSFRAFDESSTDEDDADGEAARNMSDYKAGKRREVLREFLVVTRCVLFDPRAFDANEVAGQESAVESIVNALIPLARAKRRAALRSCGLTALIEGSSLGPPDPDYLTVVPFSLSWHPMKDVDVVSFAFDASPISVLGMRVMRGEIHNAQTEVRVSVKVAGAVPRVQTVLGQVARSWFAALRPPSLMDVTGTLCVTTVDLTQITGGLKALPEHSFAQGAMPSLTTLYLPPTVEILEDNSITDHPSLRVMRFVANPPAPILYVDPRKSNPVSAEHFCEPAVIDMRGASGLEVVGQDVFKRCQQIEAVHFPANLKSLGDTILVRANGLTEVGFAGCNSLGAIPAEFAGWCARLCKVTLPPHIDSFGFGAFRDCKSLKALDFSPLVSPRVEFLRNSFNGCGLCRVQFPENTLRIDVGAFSGCDNLQLVDLSSCRLLKSFGPRAFTGNHRLRAIALPPNLTRLGAGNFKCCEKLIRVDLSLCSNLESIGDSAFEDCHGLEDVVFPGAMGTAEDTSKHAASSSILRKIGASAFRGSRVLLSVDLSHQTRLESIGDHAFSQCTGLFEIVLSTTANVNIGEGVAAEAATNFSMVRRQCSGTSVHEQPGTQVGGGRSSDATATCCGACVVC